MEVMQAMVMEQQKAVEKGPHLWWIPVTYSQCLFYIFQELSHFPGSYVFLN